MPRWLQWTKWAYRAPTTKDAEEPTTKQEEEAEEAADPTTKTKQESDQPPAEGPTEQKAFVPSDPRDCPL
jgi:hypothetical protein